MSFIVEDKGGDYEKVPPGVHLARCYRVIDLGTQKSEYQGQVKFQHKIMLGWEIHGQDDAGKSIKMRDGRPFAIFKNYTLSWSEKSTLRKDLQSWRGKPFSPEEMRRFDLKNILNAWCMLNVIEKEGATGGRMYSNVSSITPVPAMIKAAGLPKGENPVELFNLATPDMEMFEKFSDSLKAKIKSSPEWSKMSEKSDYDDSGFSSGADEDESSMPF